MKVALVYDRVNKWGGAERVLLALHEVFPDAPLFTSVYDVKKALWAKDFKKVIPSFLQKIPYAKGNHELLASFMPVAFETFDFSDYDLVISVTSEAAKGIITKPKTLHICYVLTPTRYLWSHHNFYFENPPEIFKRYPFFRQISKIPVNYLKGWDLQAAQRPDVMVAISTEVQKRIKKYYGRESKLIFPPVEVDKFSLKEKRIKKEKYFLYVSRLIPYKRADLVVSVFNDLGLPLIIVGRGSEEKKLREMAESNIEFIGELTDNELASYYQKARGFIFPQEEDFGIVVLEANATGLPVIAYKAGGALDTVIDGQTGIFFNKQNKRSLKAAVKKFQKIKFNKRILVKNAEKFSKEKFKNEFKNLVENI